MRHAALLAVPMSRRLALSTALLAAVRTVPSAPRWQPARPIQLVVAYPPGGVSDAVARALARALEQRLAVPVLVSHRAGAGGALAIEALTRARADGHTLCLSAITPLTLSPHLGALPYDPLADVAPVMSVMLTPLLVLGTPALAAASFVDMLATARAAPGRVRWATSGTHTTGHLALERVRDASGADITHVPYKGGAQQLSDALAGQFEVLSSNVGALQLQYVRDGRLKALAIGAPRRLPVLPDVPTLAELGFEAANLASTFGIFAPAATPRPVLERLNAALNDALDERAVREPLLAVSNVPTGGSAAEFRRLIEHEHARHRAALRGRR
jgi:tripartite-type tricarboxylate transporter receptor subunit TctC